MRVPVLGFNVSFDVDIDQRSQPGIPAMRHRPGSAAGVDQGHGAVEHAIGKSPFIVIPGHDLYVTSHDPGMVAVEHTGHGVVVEVDADQRFLIDRQHGTGRGSGPDRFVDLVDGSLPTGDEAEVDQRHIDGRNPHCKPIQPSRQGRDDAADGRGGAGFGGNHGLGGRAGPVEILVVGVDQYLVVGVGVDGGHQSAVDTDGWLPAPVR